jgi:hypothetical protein
MNEIAGNKHLIVLSVGGKIAKQAIDDGNVVLSVGHLAAA